MGGVRGGGGGGDGVKEEGEMGGDGSGRYWSRWRSKREQAEVEVLLEERCESKRRSWRKGNEWKVREVRAWVTGEVGHEKEQVGMCEGER